MSQPGDDLSAAILEALEPGFRTRLLEQGEARGLIWKDGVLPTDSPDFGRLLTYDLMSYGYSLLNMSLPLLELGESRLTAQRGLEAAAGAIESAAGNGPRDEQRDFHVLVSAAGYHLGGFSARAYSVLHGSVGDSNLTVPERALALVMLRRLDHLDGLVTSFRTDGRSSDDALVGALQDFEASTGSPTDETAGDPSDVLWPAIDTALSDNFMASLAIALLALERGSPELLEAARAQLRIGLDGAAYLGLPSQWWCHRLAFYLLGGLWQSSFHFLLPTAPTIGTSTTWPDLRRLFIASLLSRERAEI
jgi:hypothetical protein